MDDGGSVVPGIRAVLCRDIRQEAKQMIIYYKKKEV
jgi:hypothetical protein